MSTTVPESLAHLRNTPAGRGWLERLPVAVRELERRWSLTLGPPFDGPEVTEAWVAPARREDGTTAVLKIGMPHMAAEHQAEGLRFWDGNPTVRLFEADDAFGGMLIERCEPGTVLRSESEVEQDAVIADLLRRLWRVPTDPHPFRPLSDMIALWIEETLANEASWPDPGLVRQGLWAFDELARGDIDAVLLATDLHAGNVLRARRRPWLVIDPKPFVGDRAYDATQHLFNCEERMRGDPLGTIGRLADLLEVDRERVRLWMFARAAAETRDAWDNGWLQVARALEP